MTPLWVSPCPNGVQLALALSISQPSLLSPFPLSGLLMSGPELEATEGPYLGGFIGNQSFTR